eukprot:TRINITY_DN10148_c0_g1_i1.p1 TRINITY_DN10148_c0_g1~~TRINITY_DN10148_c0_g1_i1.p1  ORF type:complete len:113 (+),score=3.34 TRINITY_DN10148_c0_g1_i1:66-404(+)
MDTFVPSIRGQDKQRYASCEELLQVHFCSSRAHRQITAAFRDVAKKLMSKHHDGKFAMCMNKLCKNGTKRQCLSIAWAYLNRQFAIWQRNTLPFGNRGGLALEFLKWMKLHI